MTEKTSTEKTAEAVTIARRTAVYKMVSPAGRVAKVNHLRLAERIAAGWKILR